ncbi:MFS transporter [Exiguobacterium sp. 17-1]|uniref:MFS transporter n=1 Tax=Exiguobacterium sp. 17-1 TaxID=2931981 RepID=UPI002000161C|nr:MFS transporter [Exiguobacterium sp. 17-1]MCK2157770.1 MFS transporter [Exiguobacterium sp. 17-1]
MSKNLQRLLFGKFCSLFAASLFTFIAGLTVLRETSSGLQFALVLLAGTLPRILLSPVAGVLSDRWNRKKIIVTTEASSAFILTVFASYATFFPVHTIHYMIVSALLTALSTFLSVTLMSSLTRLIDDAELQRGNSLISSISSLSSIVAPMLAGFLLAFAPIHLFALLPLTLFALAAIWNASLTFRIIPSAREESSPSFWTDFQSGYSYLFKQRVLTTLILMALVLNFFFIALEVIYPIILLDRLSFTAFQFGTIEAALGAGLLLSSLMLALPSFTIKRPLMTLFQSIALVGMLFLSPVLPLLDVIPSNWIFGYFFVFSFIVGFILLRANIPIQLLVQRQTDPAYLGRVIGVMESLAMGIIPLGMLLFGFLSDYVSLTLILAISSFGLLVTVGVGFFHLRHDVRTEGFTKASLPGHEKTSTPAS